MRSFPRAFINQEPAVGIWETFLIINVTGNLFSGFYLVLPPLKMSIRSSFFHRLGNWLFPSLIRHITLQVTVAFECETDSRKTFILRFSKKYFSFVTDQRPFWLVFNLKRFEFSKTKKKTKKNYKTFDLWNNLSQFWVNIKKKKKNFKNVFQFM